MILAAGVLPYCYITNRFLLNLRSKEVNKPLTWSIWGGEAKENEQLYFCAKREFAEESGYLEDIKLIKCFVFKTPEIVYVNYLSIFNEEFEPILSNESEDGKWFTIEEIRNLRNKHFGLVKLINSKGFLNFLKTFV